MSSGEAVMRTVSEATQTAPDRAERPALQLVRKVEVDRSRDALLTAFNYEFIAQTQTGGIDPRIPSFFGNSVLAMGPGPAEGKVRELLEPTHVWPELIERECRAPHLALLGVLGRHMGVTDVDDDMHRLAFSLAGLIMQLWTQRDPLQAIAPRLAGASAVDAWVERLTGYGLSMVQGEMARRRAPRQPAHRTAQPKPTTSREKAPKP